MKMAYYCTGDIWKIGGGSTVLKNLLKHTSHSENDLHLFVSDYTELPHDIKNNFTVHSLATPRGRIGLELYDQFIGPLILAFGQYDRVVFLNSIVPIFYLGRMDVYFQMRMFYFEELDSFSKKIKNALGKLSIYRSTSVYVASSDHKNDIVRNLKVSKSKIKVINLAFDRNDNEISKIPDGNEYFIFISVIRPYKNLHRLVSAYVQSCEKYGENFHDLFIIGEKSNYVGMDEYMNDIYVALKQSCWAHKVRFLGQKTHSESMSYLKSSKALVFPTLFEGFGLPLLEAMALGVPAIVSNRNSLPEVGGNTVRFFDPENVDQLAQELAFVFEGHYSSSLVESARERANLFDWTFAAKAVLSDAEYKVI